MKKFLTVIFIVGVIASVYYYLRGTEENEVAYDDQPVIESKGSNEWTAVEEDQKSGKPTSKKIIKITESSSEEVAAVKAEFKQKVDLAKQAVEKCRQDLGILLPKDFIENFESDFSNIDEVIATLDSFYEIIRKKYSAVREVNDYLIDHSGNELKGDYIYEQVKALKDCGEFEEHSLMSIVLENYFDHEWGGEQKKAIISSILGHYTKIMKEPVDLIHMNVKIGSLYEFVNNDFLPAKYREEIRELQKMGHTAQEALRTYLPQEYNPNEKLSAEATRNLKQREKEEVESLKAVFIEFLTRASDEIASSKMAP